jgi:hypothetical protein
LISPSIFFGTILPAMPVKSTDNGGSLIQGPFYGFSGAMTNFEVVVLEFGGGKANNSTCVVSF